MKTKSLVVLIVSSLLGMSAWAPADTITQTLNPATGPIFTDTPPSPSASGTFSGLATFNQFNPALGTLDDITLSYDYGFSWSIVVEPLGGGGDIYLLALLKVNGDTAFNSNNNAPEQIEPSGQPTTTTASGVFGASDSLTPSDFSPFMGTGTVTVGGVGDAYFSGGGNASGSLSLTSAAETVTYTYTPALPEPASISILSLMTIFALKRRRDCSITVREHA